MNIVRWSPIRDLSYFENRMNHLLGNTDGHLLESEALMNGRFPLADIYENDNQFLVETELPGVDPKAVDVRIEDNVLTIRGERRFEEKFAKEDHYQTERYYGAFSRSFMLPASIAVDKIHAEFKDGVLSIMLPKTEEAKSKKIEIEAAA